MKKTPFLLTLITRIFMTLLVLLASPVSLAESYLVSSKQAYQDALKKLVPGDGIILKDGKWRDFEILFTGKGTKNKPITLTAQSRGNVVLSGQSNLRIAGEYLEVSGLVFQGGYSPTNTVIAFRRTQDDLAYHSRVTEVVIDHFNNPERFEADYWVMMYGRHNRFDHNQLVGKSNVGVTMVVRLDSEESRENHHRIDHNYFGPRPVLGSNGGETLRIGTSHYSLTDSHTLVENNYFDRCNGEVEIISSKSGKNTFRGNLFFESQGTLTLRHGNDNLVENNIFLGNRVKHTGGIRVINKRQTVRNNYLYGLTGHRFGGALVIMNGVPDSPINRYHQVEESIIENNSIIASSHIELAAGSDEERSAPPVSSLFRHNLIYNDNGENIIAVHDDVSGIRFQNNVLNKVKEPALSSGFTTASVTLRKGANGLYFAAAREYADIGASQELKVLDKADTGVSWYPKPGPGSLFDTGKVIKVTKAERALVDAVMKANAGDIISLAEGRHLIDRTLIIDKPLSIRSEKADSPAVIEFERTALFEIVNGGSLKLSQLNISGKSSPDHAGNTVVRTSRYSMLDNYSLIVEDSTISDLNTNHSFNFLTIAKHTFANRISISGSTFADITGHVLYMNKEREDLGLYNGEYIFISDSSFKNIKGTIADIYRGGTDESTFGPHFEMHNSRIHNVGKGKRNKAKASIHLSGVQAANIQHNEFNNSQAVLITETVGEPVSLVSHNDYVMTASPVITSLADE